MHGFFLARTERQFKRRAESRRQPVGGQRTIPVWRPQPRAGTRHDTAAEGQSACVDVELRRIEHVRGVLQKSGPVVWQGFGGDAEERGHSLALRIVLSTF